VDVLLAHGYFLAEDAAERRVMKPYPPLGLLYVSSHLKARGFDVAVFDSTFRSFADFVAALAEARPLVVGLYVTLMTKRNTLRMLSACRGAGARVVLGGPEPANDPQRYLEHGADVVVVGEGELTMQELLPRLLAGGTAPELAGVAGLVYRDPAGRIVRTAPRPLIADLDGQPLPDRGAVDMGSYLAAWRGRHGVGSVSLLTARGCPYTCRWCSRSVFGESHRRRSVARVADEVEWIAERYRPERLWYVDDVFTIHKGWILRFAEELARRGLRIPFECITRPERVDAEVADALEQLGCSRVWIGSESGSQRVLDSMDRRITPEQVRHAAGLLKRRGIEVGMFLMLGYEGERESDLEATAEHLKATDPDVYLTTVAYPIRGTEYHALVQDRIRPDGPWEETSDRDIALAGRPGRLYYRFANQWLVGEVERHRHWRAGRYAHAARAAARAGVGRLGMALTRGRRDA
jgi:radical SAM superfamily enzyme YgiQ (UPF0313 family)